MAIGGVLVLAQPRAPIQPGGGLSSPTGSLVPSLVSLPASRTFTGSVGGTPLEVTDESGWLVSVADATVVNFTDAESQILQGPMADQLYVRVVVCALATDVRLTITDAVSSISVDAAYPWPSGQPAPACPAVEGAALLTFDRPVVPPGSVTFSPSPGASPPPGPSPAASSAVAPSPSPSPSDAPEFVFTLHRPEAFPLTVRVFDMTGRMIGARQSTRAETAGLFADNTPRLLPGPSPDTLIAAWMGGGCAGWTVTVTTDLTIGPASDQISFTDLPIPWPSPTNGVVIGCFGVGIDRFVTLTFAAGR